MGAMTPEEEDQLINRLIDVEVRAISIRRALRLQVFEAHYLDALLRSVLDAALQLEGLTVQGDGLTPEMHRALTMEALLTRWDVLVSEL